MSTTYIIATNTDGTPWGMTTKESFFDPKTHLRTQGDGTPWPEGTPEVVKEYNADSWEKANEVYNKYRKDGGWI